MEEEGFMTYTGASHRGALEMLWLPFLEALGSFQESVDVIFKQY